MSEMSRMARRSMRAKIHRLTKGVEGKVDASDYGPEEVLSEGVKTGARPISRRAFKKGGKVVAVTGKDAVKHAGKRPRRAEGGKALTADSLINRDVKEANEKREGEKHIGAFKRGGRTKKAAGGAGVNADMGGKNFGVTGSSWDDDQKQAPKAAPKPQPRYVPTDEVDDAGPMPVRSGNKRGGNVTVAGEKKLIKKAFREHENAEHGGKHEKLKLKRGGEALDGELQGTRPTGGRTARASGGRTKGKTNIVIAIGRGHEQQPQGGMQPQPGMPQPPRSVPVAMPPQGPAAGAPMPMPYPVPAGAGAPPAGPMPMGRKRGGRAEYKLEDGAGGGKGRLEKIDWYGKK